MSKKYLTYEELLYHLENDDSDLEYLSEEDDGWEVNDDQTNEAHDEFEEVRVAISQDILHELEGDRSIDNCIQTQELENTVAAGTAAELCGASSGPIVQQPNQTNVKREPKKSILNTKQVLEKPKQIPSGPSKTDRINLYYTENQLTRKKDIVWRKNVTYQTPNINWYHPITPQIVELENALYFFESTLLMIYSI
ncbi:Transposase IS4 [Popillia japonica]|uniref:Transposase IS4 n=1 Tax=Popillia japonica TaxID=7064 RepID=A0AAW1HTP4_POPJA